MRQWIIYRAVFIPSVEFLARTDHFERIARAIQWFDPRWFDFFYAELSPDTIAQICAMLVNRRLAVSDQAARIAAATLACMGRHATTVAIRFAKGAITEVRVELPDEDLSAEGAVAFHVDGESGWRVAFEHPHGDTIYAGDVVCGDYKDGAEIAIARNQSVLHVIAHLGFPPQALEYGQQLIRLGPPENEDGCGIEEPRVGRLDFWLRTV